MSATITLTSSFGNFTFARSVKYSMAKLFRDTVTGQYFNPRPGERKIRCEDDAHQYVMEDGANGIKGLECEIMMEPRK